MSELSHYIKLRSGLSGCNAKQFECDKYLDCDSCLEDKIKEHDKHVIEQYKADTNLKDTIREIHDNVAREMYCKGIDDFANWLVKQGILGNRCISDGEITDYGKVYAKKYKEQLKAGGKMNEEDYCYCHYHEDTYEYFDCLDYMECEECPYYYADED